VHQVGFSLHDYIKIHGQQNIKRYCVRMECNNIIFRKYVSQKNCAVPENVKRGFFILSTKHGVMASKYTVAQDSSLCRKQASSELPSLRAEKLHFRR
jgi:hypothetical protein